MSVTRKLAVALLAASTLGASAAYASDLPARMPTKAPAPMYTPPFSWTGFYLGANAGWGWTHTSADMILGGGPTSFSGNSNGFLGGVQAGYNYQMGSFVAGLEADFQGSTNRGDVTFGGAAAPGVATLKTPWFGTVRGRLGFAADRWLLYVTGGGLYGENKLDGTTVATGPFSSSATYWTWTIGGGVERMLWDRWSVKLEYLYAGNPSNTASPPGATSISTKSDMNIVRAGLNYHF